MLVFYQIPLFPPAHQGLCLSSRAASGIRYSTEALGNLTVESPCCQDLARVYCYLNLGSLKRRLEDKVLGIIYIIGK